MTIPLLEADNSEIIKAFGPLGRMQQWIPSFVTLLGMLVGLVFTARLNTKALTAQIDGLRAELSGKIDALRAEMKQGFAELRLEFHTELHKEITPIRQELVQVNHRLERLEAIRVFRP